MNRSDPPRPFGRPSRAGLFASLLVVAGGMACESDPTGLEGLRFGQIGEVRLKLEAPLLLGLGSLDQTIIWNSDGPFQIEESISYRGAVGDRTVTRVVENPEVLAGSYAQWIAQVNDVPALRLFSEELDRELDPDCSIGRTRLTLEIRDEVREESVTWRRCADGTLNTLTTSSAGPDAGAARVAAAALLLRDRSLGRDFASAYRASVPFGTIDRGEDSEADLSDPLAITDQAAWEEFWAEHTASDDTPPEVDFDEDVVLVGGVGVRQEAGDSVEVRRVLPLSNETRVLLVEQVPGDFCSPLERIHTPFHIVRVPLVPLPVRFSEAEVVRVSCGV